MDPHPSCFRPLLCQWDQGVHADETKGQGRRARSHPGLQAKSCPFSFHSSYLPSAFHLGCDDARAAEALEMLDAREGGRPTLKEDEPDFALLLFAITLSDAGVPAIVVEVDCRSANYLSLDGL